MNRELFIPTQGTFEEKDVWRWYRNLPIELELLDITSDERQYLVDYYNEAGLLRSFRHGFFRRHYSESFFQAARFCLNSQKGKLLLDLGAGAGTQSLFFALQGARVVSLDLDTTALNILKKRKACYEEQLGYELDIEVCEQNALDLNLQSGKKIDAIYSMFAFNMMQPSNQLLDQLMKFVSSNARFCVIDGNNRSWLSLLAPSRRRNAWSPKSFRAALEDRGFVIVEHKGGVALPPLLWSVPLLRSVAKTVDGLLRRFWFLAISHQIMAQRNQGESNT